jgi:DNA-binding CsgD family transcriptional regulator
VLGTCGQLIATNGLFESLIPRVATESVGRLLLAHGPADALFEQAIASLPQRGEAPSVRSIAIPPQADDPALILHIVPVRGFANDVFSSAAAILVVTPVEPQKVPTAEVLQGLFDLTPAEARVARAIAEGRTLEAVAQAHGLSKETVRSQLKSTLGKTGLRRQADLARLLSGIASRIG